MAMAALANATPAQFSAFHGARMMLPELRVPRGRLALGAPSKKPAQMSFLGVGAPEALLVGVVALIVFGPKGLAEAAKSVGKTLRAFQPTIREVVSASQDIRGTLEQELGLDELRDATRAPLTPPKKPSVPPPVAAMEDPQQPDPTTDAASAFVDEDIEAKRRASAAAAWSTAASSAQQQQQQQAAGSSSDEGVAGASGGDGLGAGAMPAAAAAAAGSESTPQGSSGSESGGGGSERSASAGPGAQPQASSGGLGGLSIAELEAELERRRQQGA